MRHHTIFCALALISSVAAAQQGALYAFRDVTVVTLDAEEALPGQTVLVAEERTTALGTEGSVSVPADAIAIDAGLSAIAARHR